jgi:Protein of unknown function (DUF732)
MFASHRITKVAGTAVVMAGLGLAAFASAGTAAAAGSIDDTFLANISSEGIGYDSAKAAIANGHAVCEAIGQGEAPASVGTEILHNTNLTTRQAAAFVVASVDAYCPRYTPLLTA